MERDKAYACANKISIENGSLGLKLSYLQNGKRLAPQNLDTKTIF